MAESFRMQISPEVLEHLGVKLYTNFPSVVAEFVANSWDAGARNVDVSLPQESISPSYTVQIIDDGQGMTPEEINSKLLAVGRKRRKEEDELVGPDGETRRAMGRKGIGVLSGFGVADVIEFETVKDGKKSHLRLDYNEIANATSGSEPSKASVYKPQILDLNEEADCESGTTVRFLELNREQRPRTDFVKQRLARNFALKEPKFNLRVNGERVDVGDRNLKENCEFTWSVHENNVGGHGNEIMGWIGSLKNPNPGAIEPGIAIVANGRLVEGPRIFHPPSSDTSASDYLVGTIHADFLDQGLDLISTDRSSINWEDETASALKRWLESKISTITAEWSERRQEKYTTEDGNPKLRYLGGNTVDDLVNEFEAPRIEYKGEPPSEGKKLAEEVAALANTDGGAVIVGISNSGSVNDLDDPDMIEGQIVSWLEHYVNPPNPSQIQIDAYEGNPVIVIEVRQRTDHPCAVDGRFVQRVGSRVKPMSWDEIKSWVEK